MFGIWRFNTVLRGLLLLALIQNMAGSALAAKRKKPMPLSIEQYVNEALKASIRVLSADENFKSNLWGFQLTKRGLTWPQVSASASKSDSGSDNDLGTETDSETDTTSLGLTQPFLTGTNLSLTSTWTDTDTETNTNGVTTNSSSESQPQLTFGLSQPLYVFIRNDKLRTWKRAQIGWINDQDSYRRDILSIEFDARSTYYDLLLNSRTVEVERNKYKSAKLVNRVTRALVREGRLAKVELQRADIRAKQDERRIQNAETNFKKDLNEAKDFISIPLNKPIKLTSKLTYTPFKIRLQKLIYNALRHNPSLLVAKRSVELSEMSLAETREGNRPRVDLSYDYTRTASQSSGSPSTDPTSWNVRLNASWALFDATQTKLRTQQSEVSLRNSERNYDDQERQLKVNVENEYLELKRIEQQIKEFDTQMKMAKNSVKAIRTQYKFGISRLTDVFDAENQLRDLELEYLQLLVNFNKSRDRLKVLVGRDLNKLEVVSKNGKAKKTNRPRKKLR